MSLRAGLLLFCSAFLLFLLASAPASLLRQIAPLPDGVSVGNLDGTLWRGTTELRYQEISLRGLQWSLRPWGLFTGTPLKLSLEQPVSGSTVLGVSGESLLLQNAGFSSSLVTLLDELGYPQLGLDADIAVAIDEADITGGRCAAMSGQVSANNWHGDLEGLAGIGEIQGRLSCDAGRIELKVNPDNGIALSGSVVVFSNGRYTADLKAAPAPGPLFDLFAQLFGRPRDGRQFVLRARS